jgi:hypothetical protein
LCWAAFLVPPPRLAANEISRPAAPTAKWHPLGFEGLDQQVRALVDSPVPACFNSANNSTGPSRSVRMGQLVHEAAAGAAVDQVQAVFGTTLDEPLLVDETARLAQRALPATSERATEALQVPAADAAPPAGGRVPRPTTMSPQLVYLRDGIERCLQIHEPQRLNSAEDSCWSMMHAFLGWGPSCEILIGGPRGPRTNAMAWVAQNQPCGGRRLFYLDGGRIRGREGPGYQGHPAQFLAMLAQCHVDTGFELRVDDRRFTVADLIEEEKRTCSRGMELTFKLMGLVHYLGTEATWRNDRGESWDISKLLSIELSQPINGAACGGTHRLMAISYAVAKRRQEGGAIEGHWSRADKYLKDYHRYTMTLQNRDGSFGSDWFRQRADWGDLNRRIQTTGHMLEWLVFSLPDEDLDDPAVVRSVSYLTEALVQNRYHDWEVGPKGHAIRALRLYHQRMFQASESVATPLARRQDEDVQNR